MVKPGDLGRLKLPKGWADVQMGKIEKQGNTCGLCVPPMPAKQKGLCERTVAMKTVFTTGEAAEICKVSQQTIIRCFDSGRLRGFRVPGSRFRRIPRDAPIAFMKDNGLPPDAVDSGKSKLLVVDDDPEIVELFVDVLERDGRFEVKTAATGYDAGIQTKELMPDL